MPVNDDAAAVSEAPAAARGGGVQSVERVFDLMEIIADAGGEISLSDLAASSQLPLPTIHRLLRTLVALGYARQLPSRHYALGARLIRLGEQAGKQLGTLAGPQLKRLVDELGETANLAMLDGDGAVYVAQRPSPHAMRMFTEVGRRVPLHNTGVGKALLSTMGDAEVARIISRTGLAPQRTPKSHATPEELLADLATIREQGYAVDDEEQELGVRCYALTVPGAPVPIALSVSGPLARVDLRFAARALPVLRDAAEVLGRELARN
ncbi:IclR family acetate operon transcriptional repressor [Kineosphaera limosa]|uniref:Glycerol operon regulatory protein n=1 Tax=Kineosphaera limosa NBRC 100340 TaxID=1184609 RepID=K6WP85_9MICO|nr:IclR family transcriptional regulator [Kineosphaera limosa]NYD99681.1 IclR family acetate operon transcriptional repressor [Kineosphaera limosa]GAB95636.1 putative IclR family transcriptional regulator [Kineosphaera limosa NBRC 100340]